VALAKRLERGREQQIDHRRDADRQRAAPQRLGVAHLQVQLAHRGQHVLAVGVDDAAGVGQAQLAPVADQQLRADLVLELAHHLADGRLGHVQRLGGLGEAVQAHGFNEIAQRSDIQGFHRFRQT
jgi:hypothetical protein